MFGFEKLKNTVVELLDRTLARHLEAAKPVSPATERGFSAKRKIAAR